MNWPSCRIKQIAKNPFAIQLPLSFEQAIKNATVNVKAQRAEFDFGKEILRFRQVMMNRAMAKLKNTLEAKEWVQQAYYKALMSNANKPWEPKSNNWQNDLSAFLCRIVDNEITSHFRKKREFIEPENCNLVARDFNSDREMLESHIDYLSNEEREIIDYTLEGMNDMVISRMSGNDFNTVKKIKHRSIEKLRRRIGT